MTGIYILYRIQSLMLLLFWFGFMYRAGSGFADRVRLIVMIGAAVGIVIVVYLHPIAWRRSWAKIGINI